ncbi:hypothetical protein [Propionivibrio sp.]|uniref:hypothetical protein n=1 Tax=Propionivibrio sp. TaxID=2212460 RepID=UPI0039E243A3
MIDLRAKRNGLRALRPFFSTVCFYIALTNAAGHGTHFAKYVASLACRSAGEFIAKLALLLLTVENANGASRLRMDERPESQIS